jgi:hypothetical protein
MAHCSPNDGGCWFCSTDDNEMYFSTEFDTYFHMNCLKQQLKKDKDDIEAHVIAREFNLV